MTEINNSQNQEMMKPAPNEGSDPWFDWLVFRRHAGDPEQEREMAQLTGGYADRVLDAANLRPGMTFVDLGAGEGLLAFRAIERVGESLTAVLVDISAQLLKHAEQRAVDRGVRDQCDFIQASAERLADLDTESVDVVAARSSLAYVADKKAALKECFRILKPGGRLSIAEPVMRDCALAAASMRSRLEEASENSSKSILPFLHRWRSAQYPDTVEAIRQSPIANYSERDLIVWAEKAGFRELHLELHISIAHSYKPSWDVFANVAPHPFAPTLNEILASRFTKEEGRLFETVLRSALEKSELPLTTRMAYLTASKP